MYNPSQLFIISDRLITLTSNLLDWPALTPNTAAYETQFATFDESISCSIFDTQPRLENGLNVFCHPRYSHPFMLINAEESHEYLALVCEQIKKKLPPLSGTSGVSYAINGHIVTQHPASQDTDKFSAKTTCIFADWVESEQLFGCLRSNKNNYELSPGLLHQVNGGILVLSMNTILAQPLLWLRLKKIITIQNFQWQSTDESLPLPLNIPDMPMQVKLVLVGDAYSLGDFELIEPELTVNALYAEFESLYSLEENNLDITPWCHYVSQVCQFFKLPQLDASCWPVLIRQAIRRSGDQNRLPTDLLWIRTVLQEAALYTQSPLITGQSLISALMTKRWRESYVHVNSQDEILSGQILIQTTGMAIGQINGLSVLQYPGHPLVIGEPTRITCVAHIGDGEVVDVERKVDLGGNIHAKGMMIMQSFLISELELDQQFPLSASIVFEQSYGEIDGDSASLAELCALISALSGQPLTQQVAVTGSVDQFGNVQPIGGVNEKIEAFFDICHARGLTEQQGVIIPAGNMRHLCLKDEVIDAVRTNKFFIWSVETVDDTLPLLTGLPWRHNEEISLHAIIQERVNATLNSDRKRIPFLLRWLNWFNR